MKFRNKTILVLCTSLLPTAAFANAGTPLMWAGMLHLVFGNALIGILEGYVLAKYFGLRKRKTIGILILANYFSAWAGLFLLEALVHAMPLDLDNAWFFFWAMVAITYIITLVLELPFVVVALPKRWRRKSIRGSLIIQTISYALLFGWYWRASGTSLYTKTDIVQFSEISCPQDVLMYFISSEDGDVYTMNLVTSAKSKVFDLQSTNISDRLFVRISPTNSNQWDLLARLVVEDRDNPQLAPIREAFASEAAPSWISMRTSPPQEEDTWFNFGEAARLGSAKNSPWDFRSGFYPIEGLRGRQTKTGPEVGFSFETPFGAWNIRNVTLLPSDKVLFQLGTNQICIFDPYSNRVALVTKGRGPIAVVDDKLNQD